MLLRFRCAFTLVVDEQLIWTGDPRALIEVNFASFGNAYAFDEMAPPGPAVDASDFLTHLGQSNGCRLALSQSLYAGLISLARHWPSNAAGRL